MPKTTLNYNDIKPPIFQYIVGQLAKTIEGFANPTQHPDGTWRGEIHKNIMEIPFVDNEAVVEYTWDPASSTLVMDAVKLPPYVGFDQFKSHLSEMVRQCQHEVIWGKTA